jgi:hypothetical protein
LPGTPCGCSVLIASRLFKLCVYHTRPRPAVKGKARNSCLRGLRCGGAGREIFFLFFVFRLAPAHSECYSCNSWHSTNVKVSPCNA